MPRRCFRWVFALLAVAAALSFVISEADARAGRGFSGGSRGARTFSAPPPTQTAPNTAAPIQRSMTQPGVPTTAAPAAATSGFAGRANGFFGGGLLGGLAMGFLGAGLFGMLFGSGFMAGLGSFAGFLGLLLQIALVVIVARLAWAWWQRRSQPAFAGASPRDNGMRSGSMASFLGMGAGAAPSGAPLKIEPEDFDEFERLLRAIQAAYSDENLNALRLRTTPEMFSYFSEDLAQNAGRGMVNKISDVNLLQGDLSEAWREGNTDYATTAMRFGLVDQTLDRTTGKVVEGSTSPTEAKELWTFRRAPQGEWTLSAIQQT